MILRCVSWSIFLCLALRSTVTAQVEVNEQGYQNVLISFSPNVPSENGQELVKAVEELLEITSSALKSAVGIRIASATFVLPASWNTEEWENITIDPATEQAERKPDITLDATEDSAFGKQPVTLQHGGCGVAGHQITLPVDFLKSTDAYPKGKLLAREWLKYRYGVFEENGFKSDDMYPDYYRIPGSSDIRITECTNSEVKYTFKNPNDDEECVNMDSQSEFGHCRPHADEESAANVTSSLMYFHPDLQNMEHICGKDNHSHHDATLSKQNILCNGKSIWDVISLSKDFNIPQQEFDEPVQEPDEEVEEPEEEVEKTIKFSYVHIKPRFVVLVETSDKLLNLASPIEFALKRFYFDLPPKSMLAIHTFDTTVTEALPYAELPAEGRDDLSITLDYGAPSINICTSCALLQAIKTLNNGEWKGSILLITASPLDITEDISEKFKDIDVSLSVLRFTGAEEADDTTYEPLEDSFKDFEYDQIEISSDTLLVFKSLFTFLTKPVPHFKDGFEIKTVLTATMSGKIPVTIPHDSTALRYTLWMSKIYKSTSIQCKVGDSVISLTEGTKGQNIVSFTFESAEDDIICGLLSENQPEFFTQVQMTTKKGFYFEFDTWIHDVSTDTEQRPIIIYAKIYFGGHPVKGANVTVTVTRNESEVTSAAENKYLVKMLDNGGGDPDVTRHDGVYSGYFTDFETAGKYDITVTMDGNEETKIGKADPERRSSTCCGSTVFSRDSDAPPFHEEKLMTYEALNKMPDDGYAPSRIVDLRVGFFNISEYAILTWTAPGGGKASSYEFYSFCDIEDCEDGKLPHWLKFNQTEMKPRSHGEREEAVILFSPDVPKIRSVVISFAIKSASENGKLSNLSNKAEIFFSLQDEPFSTTDTIIDDGQWRLSASDMTGIIVGSIVIGVLLLICIGALLYFYVYKPRRAKPANIGTTGYFQDNNQNDTEVSGSFRAVPIRDRGSMRRVESFPVLLYTHDQLKDFKKKVDPPLYKPSIAPRPWMSMNVLSNNEQNRNGDSKSVGSASTLPMNDKHRSAEIEQLDDISLASDKPHLEEAIKV